MMGHGAFAAHSFGFASLRSGEFGPPAHLCLHTAGVGSASEQRARERSGLSAERAISSATIERLFPRDDRWRHRHGSSGHGADHVLPAVISPSMIVPVLDGTPALGTWQSIVLVDPNPDNPQRRVRLSLLR